MLHGNPDWSFLYRKIVLALRDRFRCIAIDYPGFGLSVHPAGYGYSSEEHAGIVTELVKSLALDDMIVMGQDWGGPIGMSVAVDAAERVHGLVIGNSWFWPAKGRMVIFSLLMSSPPMQRLITKRNLFVDPLMKRTIEAKLSDAEFDHYVQVLPTPESRRAVAEFPRQIRAARHWMGEVEGRMQESLTKKPLLLTWGMRDRFFSRKYIERWQAAFQDSTVVELKSGGHYMQEDAPEEISRAIIDRFASE